MINKSEARIRLFRLVHMSFSMLGIFIAYNALQNLVSSFLGVLGYWSVATIYISFSFSAALIGPSVVAYLKPKLSLFIGALCYTSFVVANKWPMLWTLIPTATALGIGASILWTAEGTYLTTVASNYAACLGKPRSSAMGLFNGIFFAVFQVNQIVGNLIAGFILSKSSDSGTDSAEYNILMYTYIGISGVATLSMLLLPNEELIIDEKEKVVNIMNNSQKTSTVQNILRAIVLVKNPRCFLLVPIMFYSGIEQAFIFGIFTSDIVSRAIGKSQIGFVMAAFGGVNVFFSFLLGRAADKVGPGYLVLFGFLCHVTFLATVLTAVKLVGVPWFSEREWLLYLAAIVWAAGDAAWNTFTNTILGIYFSDNAEAAFANLKFWQSVGSAVPFIVGSYLRLDLKIACVFGFQVFGVMGVIFLNNFVAPLSAKLGTKELV